MVIDINNTEERHNRLMDAYNDQFRDQMKDVSDKIYKKIKEWTKSIPQIDKRQGNVFNIETRVKGVSSFEEKIYRKNYIYEWPVSDNIEENRDYIKKNLDDIIGIRINCYFVENEELLYNYFVENCNQLEGFTFDFSANKKQKNGHTIWKFTGKYEDTYNLEIQIKAVIHNIWGEVEHKTIYKNPTYDGYIDKKGEIAEALHDIMFASDKQLCSLFKMHETEESLLKSLFYCYTKESVGAECKTKILAKHYNNYFKAFEDLTNIKKYISQRLNGNDFPREKINLLGQKVDPKLIERVKSIFPKFYIDCIYKIDSTIHEHNDYDSFLQYFIHSVIDNDTSDEIDAMFNETFNGEEDIAKDSDFEVQLNHIDDILGNCRLDKEKQNKDKKNE